jgi:TetR/AcrR family transcriptional regulator, cholesterol catabolism regulator
MSAQFPVTQPVPARKARAREVERTSSGRENILREAATLFAAKGYAESGLREIAEMAGVRSATVYHHFASKEKIYEEIIRIALDAISAAVTAELLALPSDATPRMRIEASIAGHLHAVHTNKPFTSTNAHSRLRVPNEVNSVVGTIRERYSDFWRAMLEEAHAAGAFKPGLEPRMLRPLILSTLNRTLGWFDPRKGSPETLTCTVVTLLSGIWAEADTPKRVRKRV